MDDKHLAQIQVDLEMRMKTSGIERFFRNNARFEENNLNSETDWNRRVIQEVVHPMSEAIQAYIDYYTGKPGKPVKALAYIKLVDPLEAAFITIKAALDQSVMEVNLDHIVDLIGQKIEDQVRFSKMEEHSAGYVAKVKERLAKARSKNYRHQRNAMLAGEEKLVVPQSKSFEPMTSWQNWGIDAHRHIGAALVNILLEYVTFEGQPVFQKKFVHGVKAWSKKAHNKTMLVPTEHMMDWIDRYKKIMSLQSPAFRPCVIPPVEWSTPYDGGYHVKDVRDTLPLVKGRKSQVNRLTIEQMPLVYRAINGLQNMPWKVADDVLHVAKEIKRLGIGVGMPQAEPYEIPSCPLPSELKEIRGKELKKYLTDEEWEDFIEWRRTAASVYEQNNRRKSKYLAFHRTLSTADEYKQYDKIYFVYKMDNRGRIYAVSDTISPQGDDFQKGLLRFAEGKPLGEHGLYWLTVHGAGKWGYDKVSFDERIKFIYEMADDIRDFAADPLTNTGWASADKPWQFLNWCFEWAALMDFVDDGGDAKKFVSYIACAQDGSCSGLQHYAAMLRDLVGGAAVNLVPDLKPNDIYAQVATLTALKLKEKAEIKDLENPTEALLADGLLSVKDGINRKICKPPVMTKTYGSTHLRCMRTTSDYFADLQEKEDRIAKAENRESVKVHPFVRPGEDGLPMKDAEKLCASTIWQALKETVTAASDGMQFIQNVASYMAKAGSHLEWVTPTGFIVEQKELEYKSRRIKTQLMGNTRFTIAEETNKIDVNKMRTASAPNFVHSMDASHLTLAVNGFLDAGFTGIAVIHDDFGTHAADTPKLRCILRQTLVDMYTKHDVLSDFLEYNEALLLSEIDIDLPKVGELDLNLILESDYAFG